MKSQKYLNFINFLFNREEALGTDWHFDLETDDEELGIGLTVEDSIVLIGKMLNNYHTDLAHFSDWQLAGGISYLFNTAMSGYGYDICMEDVDIALRVEVILALKTFYKECYNKRCTSGLSHLNQAQENELNSFCYMFGDVTAVTCRENYPLEINNAILELLQYILTLDNIACLESGLHWLGHVYGEPFRTQAQEIVEAFIARYQHQKNVNQELLSYAHCAAIGVVL